MNRMNSSRHLKEEKTMRIIVAYLLLLASCIGFSVACKPASNATAAAACGCADCKCDDCQCKGCGKCDCSDCKCKCEHCKCKDCPVAK